MENNKDPQDAYDEAIVLVKEITVQLISFLQSNATIKITNREYMNAYTAVQKACDASSNPQQNTSKFGKQIEKFDCEVEFFKYYEAEMKKYLDEDQKKLITIQDQEQYVIQLHKCYNHFVIFLNWTYKMFQYLDRFHLKNKGTDLQSEGFKIYREQFWDKIKDQIFLKVLYFQIDLLRNDCMIPKEEIHNIIRIYQLIGFQKKGAKLQKNQFGKYYLEVVDSEASLKYYEENFQQQFAKEIENYYKKKVQLWNNLSTPEYVQEALGALEKEEQIADYYYALSKEKIIRIIEQNIIEQSAENISNNEATGVNNMLVANHEKYLKQIYQLFKRVRTTLVYIAKKFSQYLEELGNGYNNECEQKRQEKSVKEIAIQYVQQIFTLRTRSEDLVSNIFQNDIDLQKARDNAFQNFLNRNEKSPFFLATHCDNLLKQEAMQQESDLEERLTEIIKIFVHLYARDGFFKHYQKYFSTRLLNSTSKNKEAEKSMIAKFKTETGPVHVSKIVTMQSDVIMAEELIVEAKPQLEKVSKIDFQPLVLTKASWPLNDNQDDIHVPEVLKKTIETFENFYKQKYNGRFMTWYFSQGQAEVNFNAQEKERYLLIVSSYQLLILLTIDQSKESNYSKIQERCGIKSEDDFHSNIQALVMNKILVCDDEAKNNNKKGADIEDTDEIRINKAYTNKMKRVKCIPQPSRKKTEASGAGQSSHDPDLDKEREYIVDATLVRIMKGRRTLTYNELLADTVKIITMFRADIPLIKKRVESLIERAYLKRDENSKSTFHYVP